MARPNPAAQDQDAYTALMYGFAAEKAAGALPQTGTASLFTVAGGRVLLMAIIGEVVTVLGATATNLKLLHTPTVGTAVDLCAVLAVANKEAGTLFGITGTFGDALVGANAGAGVCPKNGIVLPVGNLGWNTNANDTGTVKWTAWWVPLDSGATLVAA